MTPRQHIIAALARFESGGTSYTAPKPSGVRYQAWHRRLYKAAKRLGVERDLLFRNWGDNKNVLIKPRK